MSITILSKVPSDTGKQKIMDVPDVDSLTPSPEPLANKSMKLIVIFLNGKSVFNVPTVSTPFQNINSGLTTPHAVSTSSRISFYFIERHLRS